jgi:hypothetical protein
VNELNNKFDYAMKVKWINGEEKEIPLNRAVEYLLYDIKEIKKNTSLWTDSTKIIKSIMIYGKKHKTFLIFIALLITFLLSKNWFLTLIDKFIK